MDGQTLKIAAAGCFAMVILATSVASRFDVAGSFANVFTTLGDVTVGDRGGAEPVPTSQEWRSSLSKYTTIDPEIASSTYASSTMTMTDTFARAMFESYLRKRNEIDTSGSRVTFAQDYANAFRLSIEPVAYTNADIHISKNITLSSYITALSEALGQSDGKQEHELAIFQRLITTPIDNDVVSLVEIASVYKYTETELIAVTVPEEVTKTHLALLNAVAGIHAHILDMSTITQDPLRALAGFQSYTESVNSLRVAISVIQLQANVAQIIFPPSSRESVFMKL